ncbi:hypothetical protein Vadar_017698 [Vaccinium darrowii]|uniref:Uncharacterized protein n=1 Tax=Vaccinium darrowii TaxID=229202 RepID=A0ACB7YWL2_9ERIC|nr:hypothetical protein Vadar_017698 [Vaccinium darrowii]
MGKKSVAVAGVCSILLVAMVVAVTVGVTRKSSDNAGGSSAGSGQVSTSTKAVQQLCQPTDYKQTCETALTSTAVNTSDPKQLIQLAFNVTVSHIGEAIKNSSLLQKAQASKDPMIQDALENCKELLEFSINDLKKSIDAVGSFDVTKVNDYVTDLKTWLSGAITYQQTCLEGFENTTGASREIGDQMTKYLQLSGELTSNGLAIITELSQSLSTFNVQGATGGSRKLLSDEISGGFPTWVSAGRRGLLQAATAAVKPNVVVAQDGSGQYKTINEALQEVPNNGNNTFVIYVKAGVYNEYVNISKSMDNVYLLGDGPTATKITGSRSYVGGYNTFTTSTVSVDGDRFMAKDIGFENTAGAAKHQAVALRVSSDWSVLYNCQIDGYQDTLYAHVHRQFYRECVISGTVDFIFGNAAAVFQNCKMLIRKPLDTQSCMVTAQGRTDKRQVTGTVLQNCTISAAPEYIPVQAEFQSYLGRPWKNFSRTLVMNSQIDNVIDPAGWSEWIGDVNLNTLWYAEFNNRGPGAVTTNRVTWPGIQKSITPQVAQTFTASQFLDGDSWIPATGVPYVPGMINA